MIETQAVSKNAMSFNDLHELDIEAFEIEELVELDVNAPMEISSSSSTSSSTSSSCG